MKIKHTLFAVLMACTLSLSANAAEPLTLDYQYQGTYPADFSGMPDGPLTIGAIDDGRADNPDQIRIDDTLYTLEKPLGAYVSDALQQALTKAHADMAEDSNTVVSGTIVEFSGQRTDNGIEIILRCETTLRSRNRNAWQSVLFSRTETETDDVGQALSAALDRLARELLVDDYFRLELGLF